MVMMQPIDPTKPTSVEILLTQLDALLTMEITRPDMDALGEHLQNIFEAVPPPLTSRQGRARKLLTREFASISAFQEAASKFDWRYLHDTLRGMDQALQSIVAVCAEECGQDVVKEHEGQKWPELLKACFGTKVDRGMDEWEDYQHSEDLQE